MSTTDTTKQVAPLACTRCGDEGGPFVPKVGLCEECEPETASAMRGALEDVA
ncbi:hypothetical protein ACIP8U_00650 [Streptomyces pseudovenezuelae]|uniref:hypothetical protein n=1 Tax=Streptomyces pseudovenezuelae TaxID=67350 RepID=UPI0037FFC5B4